MDSWPQEVLFSFFSHADLELLGICSQVCVRWFQMSKDNELWRRKCIDLSMPLPKKSDCTTNQLIPTKDGDSRIDWRRVYSIKKRWPASIRCLRSYCAHLSDHPSRTGANLMKLIDRVATAEWLTWREVSDVKSAFSCTYRECRWSAELENINLYSDFEDLFIFFIHLDLSVINRPSFQLHSPRFLGVFAELANRKNISLRLLWTVVHFARELVRRAILELDDRMAEGFCSLHSATSIFNRVGPDAVVSPQKLELLRELTVQVVTAFNAWINEPYMVIDRQRDFFNRIVYQLREAYEQLRVPLFENFLGVFSQCGILPPKSVRDHLTLVFFGNHVKMTVTDWTGVDDWMKSLPSPTGSSNDIVLFLYHFKIIEYANLWKTEDKLCDEPKIQLACDFLIFDAFSVTEDRWQLDLLKMLASNSERKIFVLSKRHEDVLFEKLKVMYYGQSNSPVWKECVTRLITALNRTTELKTFYFDMLIELRYSMCEDLFLFPPPIQEIVEEYKQNPSLEMEQLLIRWLYITSAAEYQSLSDLPLNSYSLIFDAIGNHRDQYRSKKEDEQRIKSTDEGVNDAAANMKDAKNHYDKDSEEYENELWASEHLLDLLKDLINEKKFAEEVRQNLTKLLNMVKTKFGDSDITLFLKCLVSELISKDNDKSETEQRVADEIIEFVIDWLSDVNKFLPIELLKNSEIFETLSSAATRKDRAELLAELRSKRISLEQKV